MADRHSLAAVARSRAGADEMLTPREIIRDYLTLLNILRDNDSASFDDLMNKVSFIDLEGSQTSQKNAKPQTSSLKKVTIFDIDI